MAAALVFIIPLSLGSVVMMRITLGAALGLSDTAA
jgi:hypothetical protein